MKIDIERITSGSMDGEYVWICDYRRPDLNKKPIRNVPAQKVLVVSKRAIKGNVYYSDSAFLKLNKKGEPTKTAIKVFNNTRYRSYTGEPLNAFDNKDECVEKWNNMLLKAKRDLNKKRASIVDELTLEINALDSMLK